MLQNLISLATTCYLLMLKPPRFIKKNLPITMVHLPSPPILRFSGSIGLALDCAFGVPLTNSHADVEAASRFMEFFVGWFADPIFGKGLTHPPVLPF